MLPDNSSADIRSSPRRKSNDQPNGAGRISLGLSNRRASNSAGSDAKEATTRESHRTLHFQGDEFNAIDTSGLAHAGNSIAASPHNGAAMSIRRLDQRILR